MNRFCFQDESCHYQRSSRDPEDLWRWNECREKCVAYGHKHGTGGGLYERDTGIPIKIAQDRLNAFLVGEDAKRLEEAIRRIREAQDNRIRVAQNPPKIVYVPEPEAEFQKRFRVNIPVAPEVAKDIVNRVIAGKQEYGVPLTTNNGRKALQDAYEEALDLAMYLKQRIMEEDG